jgi:pimeloyl-ACP methyl ester carboxylesterase
LAGYFTESEIKTKRAVIVVHGVGAHPDWPEIIYPLRVGLTTMGWSTLSIQMPILANGAEAQAYAPLFAELDGRFNAAIVYLDNEGYTKISIVAHSMGAAMAMHFLSSQKAQPIGASVMIGMGSGISGTVIDTLLALERSTVPILDIYGSDDLETVLKSSKLRAKSDDIEAIRYIQQEVGGADHFFQGYEDLLLEKVSHWLKSN